MHMYAEVEVSGGVEEIEGVRWLVSLVENQRGYKNENLKASGTKGGVAV